MSDAPLMPDDGYPEQLTAEGRAAADELLRPNLGRIPTTPGEYLDKDGSRWILDAEGGWTDDRGERRDRAYAPLLAVNVPFSGPVLHG